MPPSRSALAFAVFALGASSGFACYSSTEPADGAGDTGDASTSSATDASGKTDASTGSGSGKDGGTGSGGDAGGTGTQTSDLPCAVATLLANNCQSCHGDPPTNGAPMSLLTRANLLAPSPSHASITVAESAVTRISATDGTVMPPSPASPLSPADIATFDAYVSAGLPVGGCSGTTGGDGGGGTAGDGGGTEAGTDAGAPTVVCTSGKTWTDGDHGSALMHPGEACIACHTVDHGPTFAAAGTVFPTLHEPDNCDGADLSGMAIIDIVDSKGVETKIPVDSVGNFHAYADQVTITPPFSAAVVEGTARRAMSEHQTTGDCNSCHTVDGANGAPGRIMEP
jgi:mono/diheme cytochrome c family protein